MPTVWEMAIKAGLGRLSFPGPFDVYVATLPHHHRDPFDRLLVAQALADSLPIVSVDAALDAYGVRRVW